MAARSHWSARGGLPSHYKNIRALWKLVRLRRPQTVLALFPNIFKKLGKVMMGRKNKKQISSSVFTF